MNTTTDTVAVPPFRCKGCRTDNPPIEYGELGYCSQVYHLEDGDWDAYESADIDGSFYVSAKCANCERDLVLELIEYDLKYQQDPTVLENPVPADFVHEVRVPLGIPVKRTARRSTHPILNVNDEQLDSLIAESTKALGEYLDERDARNREKAKRAAAEKAALPTCSSCGSNRRTQYADGPYCTNCRTKITEATQ